MANWIDLDPFTNGSDIEYRSEIRILIPSMNRPVDPHLFKFQILRYCRGQRDTHQGKTHFLLFSVSSFFFLFIVRSVLKWLFDQRENNFELAYYHLILVHS